MRTCENKNKEVCVFYFSGYQEKTDVLFHTKTKTLIAALVMLLKFQKEGTAMHLSFSTVSKNKF